MSVKQTMLLEWLKDGVLNNIVSIKKAKDMYESFYAPVKDFDKFLFQV
jgi:hypothetical protein